MMETNERREGIGPPPSRPGPGVVELVRDKLEEVAAKAEWALGSEEGRREAWLDEADDDGQEEDFFEDVARAIEQTLWDDPRADHVPEPGRAAGEPEGVVGASGAPGRTAPRR